MELKQLLEKYVPYNEQEIKDKETMLKYIDTFSDVLTRNNDMCHFTCSAFILNKTKDKMLMIHHNIYNSWAWVGGHADGEGDFLEVTLREIAEETGIKDAKPLSNDIFVIDILPVKGHVKHGKYVSAHVHLSVAYLVEADENEPLSIKEDENSGVKWIPVDKIVESSSEPQMQVVYQKAIDKLINL